MSASLTWSTLQGWGVSVGVAFWVDRGCNPFWRSLKRENPAVLSLSLAGVKSGNVTCGNIMGLVCLVCKSLMDSLSWLACKPLVHGSRYVFICSRATQSTTKRAVVLGVSSVSISESGLKRVGKSPIITADTTILIQSCICSISWFTWSLYQTAWSRSYNTLSSSLFSASVSVYSILICKLGSWTTFFWLLELNSWPPISLKKGFPQPCFPWNCSGQDSAPSYILSCPRLSPSDMHRVCC